MTVQELFVALSGANAIQFETGTARKYRVEDTIYCRRDFWHKFRMTDIWSRKIVRVHTAVKTWGTGPITIITIGLQ